MTLPYYLDPKPDLGILMSDKYVVFDFETTSIEKGSALNEDNRLLMAAWYTSWDDRFHYKWADEYSQAELVRDLRNADVIVAHNANFEWHWLARMGMKYGERMTYDTMIGDYVIAGNRKMSLDLDTCCKRHGLIGKAGLVSLMMDCNIMPEDIPDEWVIEYGVEDVRATRDLFLKQRNDLKRCGLLPVMFTRCIQTPVLAAIEARGMQLDCERVLEAYQEASDRLTELNEELYDMAGDTNMNSPPQLAKLLYDELKFKENTKYGKPDRTPSGGRKTDMGTIENLKATNKKQRKFKALVLEQSKVSASLSKNLELFKALCEQRDGVFYGNYMQTRTATHRLSATGRKLPLELDGSVQEKGAQLQNIPRAMKDLFMAREGTLMVEVDYAQLEWRVAGMLGKDEQLKRDVLDGIDVHSNCRDVLNVGGMEVDRTGAKQYSFKPQYSMVMEKKKPTAADKYAQWYKDRYSQLAETQTSWAHACLREKRLKTPWGLIYHFPYCRLTNTGYIEEVNKIFNYPIQGFGGAEIMGPAMVYLYWELEGTDRASLCNTVHDSIEAEVKPEHLDWYYETAARCLIDRAVEYVAQVYDFEVEIPLGIGFIAGKHWSENDLTQDQIHDMVSHLRNCGYEQSVADGHEVKITYHEVNVQEVQ